MLKLEVLNYIRYMLQHLFETITIRLHSLISNKKFDLRIDIHYTVFDRYNRPIE